VVDKVAKLHDVMCFDVKMCRSGDTWKAKKVCQRDVGSKERVGERGVCVCV
jgi:hypothetical protein